MYEEIMVEVNRLHVERVEEAVSRGHVLEACRSRTSAGGGWRRLLPRQRRSEFHAEPVLEWRE